MEGTGRGRGGRGEGDLEGTGRGGFGRYGEGGIWKVRGGGRGKKDMKITIMTSEPLNSDGTYFYCTKRQHVCRELNEFQKRLRATMHGVEKPRFNRVTSHKCADSLCVCVCVCVCVSST